MFILLNLKKFKLNVMKKSVFILFGIASLVACKKKEPTVCISSDKTDVLVGEVIQFTNCSEDHLTSEWNFGDGENTNVTDPSHVFSKAGEQTVNLKVVTKDGISDETTSKITVNNLRLKEVEVSDVDISNAKYQFIASVGGVDLSTSGNVKATKSGSSLIYKFTSPSLMYDAEMDIVAEKQEETVTFFGSFWETTDSYSWKTNPMQDLGDKTKLTFEDASEGLTVILTFERTLN